MYNVYVHTEKGKEAKAEAFFEPRAVATQKVYAIKFDYLNPVK